MTATDPADARPGPADLALFDQLFASVAEEMGVTLKRTAFSPNIKERRDFSCAVFDARGAMVAQAAHIPVHLGAMPASVAAALDALDLGPGDVAMLNDPYAGGTHLPDVTLVSPVDLEGERFGYLATRAHHADVGGASPGSLPLAREIHQEGLRVPPVKLYAGGERDEAILALFCANSRTPRERLGDLRAQAAAHRTGERRLAEAAARHGVGELGRQAAGLLRYGERRMRSALAELPDGTYRFEDALDGDGIEPGPIRIAARLTVEGETATADLSESDPVCAGNLNAVEAITRSAVTYAFLCLLMAGSDDPPPLNAGCFAPIAVRAPAGRVVSAEPPAAVGGGNVETSQRIVDVILGALARAAPDRIPAASQGTMNNLALGGRDPATGEPFAYYETTAGGAGAGPGGPGADAVQTHMTNTWNTPAEALELAAPLRVRRIALAPGTGGRGRHRGGAGMYRELEVLAPATGTLLTERRDRGPYGLAGGAPGSPGKNALLRHGRRHRLPGKTSLTLEAGDVIAIRTPGGGGWGA